jgi:hypothetical protein
MHIPHHFGENNNNQIHLDMFKYSVSTTHTKKNLSSHTKTLGSTQPLTEMNTRNLPGGKVWLARKAENLTAFCEPIV